MMDFYVDKTMINESIKSFAGSTAVHSLYYTALGVCTLSRWLVWLSTRFERQCQRFLVFSENKKVGVGNVPSRSPKEEATQDAEVPEVKIS